MNRNSVRAILVVAIAGLMMAVPPAWAERAGAAATSVGQDADFELAGTWVLNTELSDEAPDRESRRRGRGGRGSGSERFARMREAMREATAASRRFAITGDHGEVVLTLDDERVVRLIPDGSDQPGASAGVTRTARWHGETLEVEIKLPTRRTVTVHRTYELQDGAADGRQLVVTSRIDGGRGGGRENRRVYDEAEP